MPKAIWEKFAQSPFQQEDTAAQLRPVADQQIQVLEVQNRINLINLAPRTPLYYRQTIAQILHPVLSSSPRDINDLVSYWLPADISSNPYKTAAIDGSNRTWNLGNTNGYVPTYAAGPKWTFGAQQTVYPVGSSRSQGYPFNGDHTFGLVLKNVSIPSGTATGLLFFVKSATDPSVILFRDTDNLYKLGLGTGLSITSTVTLSPQPSTANFGILVIRNSTTGAMDFYLNSLTPAATTTYAATVGSNFLSQYVPTVTSPTSFDLNEMFFISRQINADERGRINNYWQTAYGVGVAN